MNEKKKDMMYKSQLYANRPSSQTNREFLEWQPGCSQIQAVSKQLW